MTRFAPAVLDRIRSALPMPSLVGQHVRLKRAGRSWSGLCPFHGEKRPSFAVYDDHFHCFGCGAHGDVFGWFGRREGLEFPGAVARAAAEAGMSLPNAPRWAPRPVAGPPPSPLPREPSEDELREEAQRIDAARRIWIEAGPIGGVVQTYLESRKLWPLPAEAHRVLRQAQIRHPDTKRMHHAMVARIDGPAGPMAVHRTFLEPDGRKLQGVDRVKLVLGPLRAGAIRLAAAGERLGLAEGIETALAATRLSAIGTWACISASVLAQQEMPMDVRHVTIFADRDAPKQFREGAGLHYARICADGLRCQGVEADIRLPAEPWGDYADVWADVASAEAGWAA
nr:CHC2 zinc finger domain-containing protein [uncultured Roseococcus sp.]